MYIFEKMKKPAFHSGNAGFLISERIVMTCEHVHPSEGMGS